MRLAARPEGLLRPPSRQSQHTKLAEAIPVDPETMRQGQVQQIQANLKVQHSAQHSHKVLHMPSVLQQLDSSRTPAVLLNSNGDCDRAPRLGVCALHALKASRCFSIVSIPNVLDAFGCGLEYIQPPTRAGAPCLTPLRLPLGMVARVPRL